MFNFLMGCTSKKETNTQKTPSWFIFRYKMCSFFSLYKLDFTFFYHFFLTSTKVHKKQLIKTSNTWHRKIYFMDLKEYWKMCCSYCGNLFLIKRLNYINIMDHKSTHQKNSSSSSKTTTTKPCPILFRLKICEIVKVWSTTKKKD